MNDSYSTRSQRRLSTVAALVATPAVLLAIAASFPQVLGLPSLTISEEILKAVAFFCLITAVILNQSHFIGMGAGQPKGRKLLGAMIDISLILALAFFTFTYLHETIVEKPELFPSWIQLDADPVRATSMDIGLSAHSGGCVLVPEYPRLGLVTRYRCYASGELCSACHAIKRL